MNFSISTVLLIVQSRMLIQSLTTVTARESKPPSHDLLPVHLCGI